MKRELALLKEMSPRDVPTGIRGMTENDYDRSGLLEKIRAALTLHGIPSDNIRLELTSPKWWAVSLFLPYEGLTAKNVNRTVKKLLVNDVGIDKCRITAFGKISQEKSYVWYFVPPGVPEGILAAIDHAGDLQDQKTGDHEIGWGIPIPNKTKDTGKIPLLVVTNEEIYRRIERGEKTVEYRNLVTYYCNKFLGTGKMVKAVRFQLGYGAQPEQMVWSVDALMLASEHGKLAPAMTNGEISTFKDLPNVFPPMAYAIKLGTRLPKDVKMRSIPDPAPTSLPSEATVDMEPQRLVEGIKSGEFKSKKSEGYLILKAKSFDAIEFGETNVEYCDFTENNVMRLVGIETIRFSLGRSPSAPKMTWSVKKCALRDDDDNECDPFNVPEDFCPTTIAIHLGKRIA